MSVKLAYANARFRLGVHEGPDVHVRQFVQNAVALGHELWMWPGVAHPLAEPLPATRLARVLKLRDMDVIYVRLGHYLPRPCTWTRGPTRMLLGDPLMVWEFNTVPEFGEYWDLTPQQVQRHIDALRHFGKGCDLAVCVSQHLADYVHTRLGITRTLVAPNGSDPGLYRPDATVVRRLRDGDRHAFNVVWIGSAYVPWHNFALLGAAAEIIWQRGNRWHVAFHLIGEGMSQMRDMPPHVHYHGVEDYELLPGWMSAMHVGLCLYRPGPADYSSPLKVFDYMASGLAVVTTPQPQTTGLLVELGTPELQISSDDATGLADALEALAADRERTKGIGRRARELIAAKYTWRRAVAHTLAQIERLAALRARRAA